MHTNQILCCSILQGMAKISRKSKVESQKLKQLILFLKRNYFLLIFVGCIGFVGVVVVYKTFIVKPTYIYAKVKVGQGLWWASTQRPSLWFVRAIQKAQEQKDLKGIPLVKMIDVAYYPYYGGGQYDIYVTVRLKVSKVGSKGTYNFNRETIGVSAPIDLEFPNIQFSGTIIALSEGPMREVYEKKTVYLFKKNVNPWEFDQLRIGDFLSIGKEKIFEVLDKTRGETNDLLLSEIGRQMSGDIEPYRYVSVKASIRVKKIEGQYLFGEEYIVSPGRGIPIVLGNLTLNDYTITKVE